MIRQSHRTAFTLVEMLVAITIASILTLIALPAAKEAIRQHTVSRSAEIVRLVFINAHAQAIRQNRSFGVVVTRKGSTGIAGDYSTKLQFATEVPEYHGDAPTSVATVSAVYPSGLLGAFNQPNTYLLTFPQTGNARLWRDVKNYNDTSFTADERNEFTLRVGATLTLGRSYGPLRVISCSATTTGTLETRLIVRYEYPNVPPVATRLTAGQTLPYAIRGVPQASFLPDVDIPRDAVVDLSLSGIGLDGMQFNSDVIRCQDSANPGLTDGFERVTVMFGKSGNVTEVYFERWDPTNNIYFIEPHSAPGTIYFAIGRADGVRTLDEMELFDTAANNRGALPNFASPETIWLTVRGSGGAVGISPQTPAIEDRASYYTARSLTAPTASVGTCARVAKNVAIIQQRLRDARRLAQTGSSIQ